MKLYRVVFDWETDGPIRKHVYVESLEEAKACPVNGLVEEVEVEIISERGAGMTTMLEENPYFDTWQSFPSVHAYFTSDEGSDPVNEEEVQEESAEPRSQVRTTES